MWPLVHRCVVVYELSKFNCTTVLNLKVIFLYLLETA